ncbi:flagellar motor protein MotD [Lysobacter korlensis]|uniref:Flagellar motor protein MotD n=1 Tax=Lysobacter korlensis TaxID=553636 RepID=A0ABV6RJ76_9GAMM
MRSRRHQHEEHVNHEAWAIPYGDLVTLLLAFFVVMYAVSSVNEGKYRVMADAMSVAFGGPPSTLSPVQLGETMQAGDPLDRSAAGAATASAVHNPRLNQLLQLPPLGDTLQRTSHVRSQMPAAIDDQLGAIGARVERALSGLVAQGLVTVRRSRTYLEVEIQSDLLFASGVAVPSPAARTAIRQLADVLRGEPNAIRVEGYTDNRPIRTAQFRSNWELSAARAASVVHELSDGGIAEPRLAVIGYGEHHPVADNATVEGRNANRRVQLVILAATDGADTVMPERAAPPAVAASVAAVQTRAAPTLAQAAEPDPETRLTLPLSGYASLERSVASSVTPVSTTAGVH